MARPSVLVIEDAKDIRETLVAYLRRCLRPAQIVEAADAAHARRVLATRPIDVILADHYLPDGDGASLLEEARTSHPDAVRLLMTAFPESDVLVDACNRARVAKVYRKPFDPSRMGADIALAADGKPIPPDTDLAWAGGPLGPKPVRVGD